MRTGPTRRATVRQSDPPQACLWTIPPSTGRPSRAPAAAPRPRMADSSARNTPSPGAKGAVVDAIAEEQAYVDACYGLLDSFTGHVQRRMDDIARAPGTGTGQDLMERQAHFDNLAAQLTSARAASNRLCFGRIDPIDAPHPAHRSHGPARRRRRAGPARLAGPVRGRLLPGDPDRADGPGQASTHHQQGPNGHPHRGRGPRRPDGNRRRCRGRRRGDPPRGSHGRHHRDDRGRSGPDRAKSARPGHRGRGRTGHRQDRRRPPPRRVAALHLPRTTRQGRRARDRALDRLPPLHRPGPAEPGRDRRRAPDARAALPSGVHQPARRSRRRGRQGRPVDGEGDRERGAGTGAGARSRHRHRRWRTARP